VSKHIGVVGLGIMGSAISGNFLKAGYAVTGYDITAERRDELAGKGGAVAGSPGEVAARADIVLTSLPSSAALDQVVSADDGIAAAANGAAPVMECSTLPIEDKLRNRDKLAAVGVTLLDTPLSGTGAQAVNKDLAVYLSGDEGAANACVEIVEGFARAHYYVGEFGNGSKMKYVANHLVAIHNIAAAALRAICFCAPSRIAGSLASWRPSSRFARATSSRKGSTRHSGFALSGSARNITHDRSRTPSSCKKDCDDAFAPSDSVVFRARCGRRSQAVFARGDARGLE